MRLGLWGERSIVAELSRLRMLTSTRIAKELGVSQTSVVKAIQWLRDAGVWLSPLFQPRRMGLKRVVVRIDMRGLGRFRATVFNRLAQSPEVYRVFRTFEGDIVAVIDQPLGAQVPIRGTRWEVLGVVECFARSLLLDDALIRLAIEGRASELLSKCSTARVSDDLRNYLVESMMDCATEKIDWIDLEIADVCMRKPEVSLKELASELRSRGVKKTTSVERHVGHAEKLVSGYGIAFVRSLSESVLVFEADSLSQVIDLVGNPLVSQIVYPGRFGRPLVLVRTLATTIFDAISMFEDLGLRHLEVIDLRGSAILSIPTKGRGYSSARSWSELRPVSEVLESALGMELSNVAKMSRKNHR